MRVLSGVANLASEYDCSNPCIFRDLAFFRFDVFLTFLISIANRAFKYYCSNLVRFPGMTFYVIFFQKLFRKLELFFQKLNLIFLLGAVKVLSGVVNLASKYDCSSL